MPRKRIHLVRKADSNKGIYVIYTNMKKFLKAALLAVVVAVAGYGAYEAQCEEMQLSETMLANVEALADDETNGGTCFKDIVEAPDNNSLAIWVVDCNDCKGKWIISAKDKGHC